MHPALLAEVPSVSEQIVPVPLQRQEKGEGPHVPVEVARSLKRRSLMLFLKHPCGKPELVVSSALVSLIPKLTAAASQSAFVQISALPSTDPHKSLSTYEYVIAPHANRH